jgi:hypothetical protein
MASLYSTVRRGTFEDFLPLYEADDEGPTAWLLRALMNRTPRERVQIADRLLDDGADAAAIEPHDHVNALHVLFAEREHDFELEAPLLKRLLEGGADINLRSPRFGLPLMMLRDMVALPREAVPFYDVVFQRPDIDLDAVIMYKGPADGTTLGDILTSDNPAYAELTTRARRYIETRQTKR